jgi:hypothetical protein
MSGILMRMSFDISAVWPEAGIALAGFIVAGAILFVVYRLAMGKADLPSGDWLKNFRVERYAILERLLQDDDLESIERRGGVWAQTARRLRRERREIALRYVRLARRDYRRLSILLRAATAASSEDRSDAAVELLAHKVRFEWAVFSAECALILGFNPASAAGSIIKPLGLLRTQTLRALTAS